MGVVSCFCLAGVSARRPQRLLDPAARSSVVESAGTATNQQWPVIREQRPRLAANALRRSRRCSSVFAWCQYAPAGWSFAWSSVWGAGVGARPCSSSPVMRAPAAKNPAAHQNPVVYPCTAACAMTVGVGCLPAR